MSDIPEDGGPTEAELMLRLVEQFPGFRARWQAHLESWKGEPAGNYNDGRVRSFCR